jgi:hypothetical protein
MAQEPKKGNTPEWDISQRAWRLANEVSDQLKPAIQDARELATLALDQEADQDRIRELSAQWLERHGRSEDG